MACKAQIRRTWQLQREFLAPSVLRGVDGGEIPRTQPDTVAKPRESDKNVGVSHDYRGVIRPRIAKLLSIVWAKPVGRHRYYVEFNLQKGGPRTAVSV